MQEEQRFDVCVIGAGPAGIVAALELAGQERSVCLVDSGTQRFDSSIQALGDAARFNETTHAPMSIATRRQVGGATNIWGGRVVPFDPIDFEGRDYVPESEWPIQYADIANYHARACRYFVCGNPSFSTYELDDLEQKSIVPGFADADVLSTSLERWSLPTNFRVEYRRELLAHENIECLFGYSCVELLTTADDRNVVAVLLRSLSGESRKIRAGDYVLACGGLESTRVLMCSGRTGNGLGNQSGLLGRFYMGHLSGRVAKVHFKNDPRTTRYGFIRDQDGVYVRQRFTFSQECQRREELLNTAMWLVNPEIGDPAHRSGVYSLVYLLLASPLGSLFASEAIRRSAIQSSRDSSIWLHAGNLVKEIHRVAWFFCSFGLKRMLMRRKIPSFYQFSKANRYLLHYHAEQIPDASNRVTLSSVCDSLGMPRLNIDFGFQEKDVESVIKAHEVLDRELKRQAVGELEYLYRDVRQAVWDQAADGFHQTGTTRMSHSVDSGVVDEDCRVHGTENLYVASGSCLPTSGQANTTLTIVCLAIRIADHLSVGGRRDCTVATGVS